MKKALLIFSAVLLLAGCAKEKFANLKGGELTDVTITAQMPNEIGTRAVADGDGAAANVNRCIMEVYYGDDLFTRMYAPVDAQKKASFTLQVVSNRTYQIVFWADHVASSASEDGLNTDLYYTTNAADGLKAIALKGTYAGNDDARDAFFYSGDYTVEQGGSSFNVTLKRPFAQVNVITTDASLVRKSADLKPTKVKVVLNQAMTAFNAMTGAVSTPADLTYVADAYKTDYTADEVTLAMDYLFAAATKELIDIDFKAGRGDFESGDNTFVSHSFSSVPYQRNYRTNIKGALLTAVGKWNVTVDPVWESSQAGNEEIVYDVVADIATANDVIEQSIIDNQTEINVKFTSQPNDAGTPGSTTGDITNKAIVTTNLPEDTKLNILVEAQTKDLYIGDYQSETNTTVVTSGTESAVVNINIPATSGIQKLIINAPSKTVYVNGIQVASTGVIDDLDAIVSQSTLIVENGQTVKKLTIRQGGLEIHGVVNNLVIEENAHDTNPVKVRDCENLSAEVFAVIKGEGHNYIDTPSYSEKANSDGTWDIVPSVCKIGTDKGFATLAQAVAAVGDGETITFVANEIDATGISVPSGKNFTVDFDGHIYTVNKPGAGSTGTQTSAFQLLSGSTVTFQNGTIQADKDNLTEAVAPAKNIKRMFQSYANVTFNNMTIDGANLYGTNAANEFACGTVSIEGATSISAKEGVKAINVDTWKDYYPAGAAVTINTTGTIGDIYLYAEGTTAGEYTKSSLAIQAGKIASVTTDESGDYSVSIENGSLFKIAPDASFLRIDQEIAINTIETVYVNEVVERLPVAKVGSTQYYSIDEAVANWGHNTTLTLLKDATISSTIQIKSTEMHTLDLSTYTLTANNCDAILVANYGRTSAGYAFDVKADGNNPGGIVATGGACIRTNRYTGTSASKDRPMIRIYNGVFYGKYCIQHSNSNGTNCPQYYIYGGDFTSSLTGIFAYSVYTNRVVLNVSGGVFHSQMMYSPDQSAYTVISGGKFITVNNLFNPDYNEALRGTRDTYVNKLTYGSNKRSVTDPTDISAYNRDITVDTDGYYCVTPIIENKEEQFGAALAYTPQSVGSYGKPLDFSRVGIDKKLFYKDANMAVQKSTDKIYLYSTASENKTISGNFEMDATSQNANYTGTITISSVGKTFNYLVLSGQPALDNVVDKNGNKITPTVTEEEGIITYSYLYSE